MVLAVPAIAVTVALGAAGLAKLREPAAMAALLDSIGLPDHRAAGFAVGAVEMVLASGALLVGGTLPHAAMATAYLAFAVVLVIVLRRGGSPSCGCFGSRSAPPHAVHVAADLGAAAVALAAAIAGTPGLLTGALSSQPWSGVPVVGMGLLGAALLAAMLTVLPEVLGTRRASSAPQSFRLLATDDPA